MSEELKYKGTVPYCAAWWCKHVCNLKITKHVRQQAAREWKPIATGKCIHQLVTMTGEKSDK